MKRCNATCQKSGQELAKIASFNLICFHDADLLALLRLTALWKQSRV